MNEISEFSIQWVKFFRTEFELVKIEEGTFKTILTTKGRKSGKEHVVELRAVYHNGKFYFSRRNPNSDWLKNALCNPHVKIEHNGNLFEGIASLVKDQELCSKISRLKYPDKRSEESRIVLEVTLCE